METRAEQRPFHRTQGMFVHEFCMRHVVTRGYKEDNIGTG
jgi:hypothetical protein